jgi:hypothetical protein
VQAAAGTPSEVAHDSGDGHSHGEQHASHDSWLTTGQHEDNFDSHALPFAEAPVGST